MKNSNYDAFIFDLGRVLVDFDHDISAGKIAKLTGKPQEWLYQLFFESELTKLFDEGKVSPREFYAELKKLTGLDISFDEFVLIWVDIFSQKDDMFELVKCLRNDYRLVLMSNVNTLQFEHIRKNFPIIAEFDGLVLSYEAGAMKPDPKIYQAAIAAAKTMPEKIIYTDDRPELIDGGKKAGIEASFVFNGLEFFKNDLGSLGIEVNEYMPLVIDRNNR